MTHDEMRTRIIRHLMELEVPFEETFAGYAFPDIELKAASKVIYNIPSVRSFFIIGGSGVESYPEDYEFSNLAEQEAYVEREKLLSKWCVQKGIHMFGLSAKEADTLEDLIDVDLRYASNDDMGEWLCELAYLRGLELKSRE